jgi:hypothetical protein
MAITNPNPSKTKSCLFPLHKHWTYNLLHVEDTRGPSCTNRCWMFPIKGCFPIDLCGILIHIRPTTLFSIPDAWTAAWSELLPVKGDLIVDPNFRPPGFDLRRHNWVLLTAFEPNRGDTRTSCIDGGSRSHQLVTVVLRNKPCVT